MAELAFRMQMRGMAPGNNQSLWRKPPLLQKSGRFQTPPAPHASARRVKRRVRRYGCFQLVRQQCRQLLVMLLSGSRWRRRSRPARSPEESAQSASCPACQWRNALTAAASESAHDQMRSIAVLGGPQRYARLRIASQRLLIIIVAETG